MSAFLLAIVIAAASGGLPGGIADDLYKRGSFPAMVADQRAVGEGDSITVVIYQMAEAANSTQNGSDKRTDLSLGLSAGAVSENGSLGFGGGYNGKGDVRRTEKLTAQLTVLVEKILPNGDFAIVGRQQVNMNGETTNIAVRGRIRQADISSDNRVLSTRIADAQIDYSGKGFVSRSAKPGIVTRLFNLLGLV